MGDTILQDNIKKEPKDDFTSTTSSASTTVASSGTAILPLPSNLSPSTSTRNVMVNMGRVVTTQSLVTRPSGRVHRNASNVQIPPVPRPIGIAMNIHNLGKGTSLLSSKPVNPAVLRSITGTTTSTSVIRPSTSLLNLSQTNPPLQFGQLSSILPRGSVAVSPKSASKTVPVTGSSTPKHIIIVQQNASPRAGAPVSSSHVIAGRAVRSIAPTNSTTSSPRLIPGVIVQNSTRKIVNSSSRIVLPQKPTIIASSGVPFSRNMPTVSSGHMSMAHTPSPLVIEPVDDEQEQTDINSPNDLTGSVVTASNLADKVSVPPNDMIDTQDDLRTVCGLVWKQMNEKSYLCNFCDYSNKIYSQFNSHLASHIFSCEVCNFKSFTRFQVLVHKKINHPECIHELSAYEGLDKLLEKAVKSSKKEASVTEAIATTVDTVSPTKSSTERLLSPSVTVAHVIQPTTTNTDVFSSECFNTETVKTVETVPSVGDCPISSRNSSVSQAEIKTTSRTKIKCCICSFSTFEQDILENHMDQHKSSEIGRMYTRRCLEDVDGKRTSCFYCSYCLFHESSESRMVEHVKKHSTDVVLSAVPPPPADKNPPQNSEGTILDKDYKCLTSVSRDGISKKVYICKKCKFRSESLFDLGQHDCNSSCFYCNFSDKEEANILQHIRTKHAGMPLRIRTIKEKVNEEKPADRDEDDIPDDTSYSWVCYHCEFSCPSRDNIISHVKSDHAGKKIVIRRKRIASSVEDKTLNDSDGSDRKVDKNEVDNVKDTSKVLNENNPPADVVNTISHVENPQNENEKSPLPTTTDATTEEEDMPVLSKMISTPKRNRHTLDSFPTPTKKVSTTNINQGNDSQSDVPPELEIEADKPTVESEPIFTYKKTDHNYHSRSKKKNKKNTANNKPDSKTSASTELVNPSVLQANKSASDSEMLLKSTEEVKLDDTIDANLQVKPDDKKSPIHLLAKKLSKKGSPKEKSNSWTYLEVTFSYHKRADPWKYMDYDSTSTTAVCKVCGKKMNDKNSVCHMKEHIQKHTGEKPWICGHCPDGYRRKRGLLKHFLRKHPNKKLKATCIVTVEKMDGKVVKQQVDLAGLIPQTKLSSPTLSVSPKITRKKLQMTKKRLSSPKQLDVSSKLILKANRLLGPRCERTKYLSKYSPLMWKCAFCSRQSLFKGDILVHQKLVHPGKRYKADPWKVKRPNSRMETMYCKKKAMVYMISLEDMDLFDHLKVLKDDASTNMLDYLDQDDELLNAAGIVTTSSKASFRCTHCKVGFRTLRTTWKHMRIHHIDQECLVLDLRHKGGPRDLYLCVHQDCHFSANMKLALYTHYAKYPSHSSLHQHLPSECDRRPHAAPGNMSEVMKNLDEPLISPFSDKNQVPDAETSPLPQTLVGSSPTLAKSDEESKEIPTTTIITPLSQKVGSIIPNECANFDPIKNVDDHNISNQHSLPIATDNPDNAQRLRNKMPLMKLSCAYCAALSSVNICDIKNHLLEKHGQEDPVAFDMLARMRHLASRIYICPFISCDFFIRKADILMEHVKCTHKDQDYPSPMFKPDYVPKPIARRFGRKKKKNSKQQRQPSPAIELTIDMSSKESNPTAVSDAESSNKSKNVTKASKIVKTSTIAKNQAESRKIAEAAEIAEAVKIAEAAEMAEAVKIAEAEGLELDEHDLVVNSIDKDRDDNITPCDARGHFRRSAANKALQRIQKSKTKEELINRMRELRKKKKSRTNSPYGNKKIKTSDLGPLSLPDLLYNADGTHRTSCPTYLMEVPDRFICPDCSVRTTYMDEMKSHLLGNHSNTPINTFCVDNKSQLLRKRAKIYFCINKCNYYTKNEVEIQTHDCIEFASKSNILQACDGMTPLLVEAGNEAMVDRSDGVSLLINNPTCPSTDSLPVPCVVPSVTPPHTSVVSGIDITLIETKDHTIPDMTTQCEGEQSSINQNSHRKRKRERNCDERGKHKKKKHKHKKKKKKKKHKRNHDESPSESECEGEELPNTRMQIRIGSEVLTTVSRTAPENDFELCEQPSISKFTEPKEDVEEDRFSEDLDSMLSESGSGDRNLSPALVPEQGSEHISCKTVSGENKPIPDVSDNEKNNMMKTIKEKQVYCESNKKLQSAASHFPSTVEQISDVYDNEIGETIFTSKLNTPAMSPSAILDTNKSEAGDFSTVPIIVNVDNDNNRNSQAFDESAGEGFFSDSDGGDNHTSVAVTHVSPGKEVKTSFEKDQSVTGICGSRDRSFSDMVDGMLRSLRDGNSQSSTQRDNVSTDKSSSAQSSLQPSPTKQSEHDSPGQSSEAATKMYQCSFCTWITTTLNSIREHVRTAHDMDDTGFMEIDTGFDHKGRMVMNVND